MNVARSVVDGVWQPVCCSAAASLQNVYFARNHFVAALGLQTLHAEIGGLGTTSSF